MTASPKVLVIGSGGREHALVAALSASPQQPVIHAAPGNPGMREQGAYLLQIDPNDLDALLIHAQREAYDLVVIGPEAPLAAGLVDRLTRAGIAAFGPTQAAARLEASKAFAKQVMQQAHVPTARYVQPTSIGEAHKALEQFAPPYVIKQDGLASGKGVTVTRSRCEAEAALTAALEADKPVIIEDCLIGQEVSLLAVCDGTRALPLVAAQDYKRAFNGQTGPNTGGMGAYAPVPWVTPQLVERIRETVLQPVLAWMQASGTPYRGILYAGLMISPAGEVHVVEFNVRFGDPETQVVLPLLVEAGVDVLALLQASANGDLSAFEADWRLSDPGASAVTVVAAAPRYPETGSQGEVITLPQALPPRVTLFQAGTTLNRQQQLVTHGGRILCVTSVSDSVESARQTAYTVLPEIQFAGMRYRRDIAAGLASPYSTC